MNAACIVVLNSSIQLNACPRCGNRTAVLLNDRRAATWGCWVQCVICGARTRTEEGIGWLDEEWNKKRLLPAVQP